MWPYVNNKVMKCGLLKLHSKYDKMNIYELKTRI